MSLSYRGPVLTLIHRMIIWPAEAVFLIVLLAIIALMPAQMASAIFGHLFALIGPFTSWHKRAREQIGYALPELSPAQTSSVLNGMWKNIGRNFGEYPKMNALLEKGYLHFTGLEHLKGHKGGFIIGAHLGNWEALAMIGPLLGLKTGLIYRPLNNPYIKFLLERRSRSAKADIYEKGRAGAMGMIATIRKGGFMLLLADQQLREGLNIPFFGRPAQTAVGHFKIAAKAGVPVFFAHTKRLRGCHIEIDISPPVFLPASATDKQIQQAAKNMNARFESWIKQHPEQWLWPHRRWGKSVHMAPKDRSE